MNQALIAAVYPRLLPLGDAALTLELGADIDPAVNQRCHALAQRARAAWSSEPAVHDVVSTFRSVTVYFDPLRADSAALGQQLLLWAADPSICAAPQRHWRLPVYFGGEHAADLQDAAQRTQQSVPELIAAVTAVSLRVYAMGFMPGFAYMAELPPPLRLPRRATPRQRVPAQSLAIASAMACVYPWVSPGGWHLLGYMPIALFDLRDAQSPALLQAGDTVAFYAVDAAQCADLSARQQSDAQFRCGFGDQAQ